MLAGKADLIADLVVKAKSIWPWIMSHKVIAAATLAAASFGLVSFFNLSNVAWGGISKLGGVVLGGMTKMGAAT